MGDDEDRLFAFIFRANPASQSISSIAPSPRECSGHVAHILPMEPRGSQPMQQKQRPPELPSPRPRDNRSHAASEGWGHGSDLAGCTPGLGWGDAAKLLETRAVNWQDQTGDGRCPKCHSPFMSR